MGIFQSQDFLGTYCSHHVIIIDDAHSSYYDDDASWGYFLKNLQPASQCLPNLMAAPHLDASEIYALSQSVIASVARKVPMGRGCITYCCEKAVVLLVSEDAAKERAIRNHHAHFEDGGPYYR